jgi:hypothetical protein
MTALAIFAVIFVAALLLYDRSNRVFSSSSQAAEMQQSTRVAFDKIVQDIRMAGFDYKRGGVPTSSFTTRTRSTAYVVGQMVLPDVANGHVYKCTTGGTTASTPITWNAGSGSTTTDSAVIWTEAGTVTAAFDSPDEQIEMAWHSALTVRGNYNFDSPDDATVGVSRYEHGREGALESTQFPVVTTGNDEIVTYVLHSDKSGAANADSVTFYVDLNSSGSPSRTAYPGGNSERLVTINNVDLSNNYPPYTLYRVTFDSTGALVRTPLADNIRSLTFDYYQDPQGQVTLKDTTGTAITDVGGLGQYNPAIADSANHIDRLTRKNIRSIKVSLVGMNSAADNSYTDPTDTVAPHNRKMALTTTIVPRNLGIVATIQPPLQPPPAPVNVAVCYGYCGIPVISWLPGDPSTYSTGSTGAESFSVSYDESLGGTFANVQAAGTLTNFAYDLTQLGPDIATKTYYFKVGATNAAGTRFSAAVGPVSLKNATKPNAPAIGTPVGAGGAAAPTITIPWTTPSGNQSGAPSCTSGTTSVTTVASEIRGYKVFRSTTSGFTPAAGNMIADVDDNRLIADGAGGWSFTDTTVGSCTPYYYRVQAIEWCTDPAQNTSGVATDAESGYSAERTGTVTANKAATPTGLTVVNTTTCTYATNQCTPVNLTWSKVTTDTSAATINVDSYEIHRRSRHGSFTGSYAVVATLTGMTGAPSTIPWSEPAPLQDHETASPFDQDYYDYYVVAKFGCGDSDPSTVATVPNNCDTGVTISTTNGTGAGSSAAPWVAPTNGSLVVKLNQGASPYTAITSASVSLDGAALTTLTSGSSPAWSYSWPDVGDGTTHTLAFRAATTSSACTQTLATVYIQASAPGCHLQTVTVDPTMVALHTPAETGSDYEIDLTLKNLSQDTVTVNSIVITDSVPKKGNWNYLELPGGTKVQTATPANLPAAGGNSGAVTYTKTFALTSAISTDKTISPASQKVYKLLYTSGSGGVAITAANITSVQVTMTTAAGGTTTFTCTVR